MLFIVNGSGVPSVGAIVQIGSAAPPPSAPTLGSLAPSSATAGGPAFTLTANGSNFVSGSTVQWNGAARTTTFVSATQLSATIAAADIAAPGTAQVSVLNPGGAASGALPFTVTAAPPPPAPALGSLAPSSATAGGPAFTLTANGSNFVSGSTVQWNGAARTTTFVSATQLRATIAAADIAAAGYRPGLGAQPWRSRVRCIAFHGHSGAPGGSGTWLARPKQRDCGGPAFTLTANGSNFVSGSTVHWNGVARTTTFVSATQLRATIAAADIAAPGTAQVSVLNPGGAASGALPFTVTAPVPTFALTVTKAGTGNATITSTPAGINCGGTCTASFASGATVTLTVKITGKGILCRLGRGACTGTANTCTVTMNASKAVTATINR